MAEEGTTASAAPDVSSSPAAPSATGTPAPSPGQASAPADQAFYSHKHRDGTEKVYKTKEELARDFEDGYLRHSDYTKKTQELAEQRKAHETEKQRVQQQLDEILQMRRKYDPLDGFFKKNQDLWNQVITRIKQPGPKDLQVQTDSLVEQVKKEYDEKLKKLEDRINGREQQEQSERARKQAFEALKTQYEDFDEEAVQEDLDRLSQAPPGQELYALNELLHFARKGRLGPEEMKKQITERLAKKQAQKLPMTPGGAAPRPTAEPKDWGDARERALNELGG